MSDLLRNYFSMRWTAATAAGLSAAMYDARTGEWRRCTEADHRKNLNRHRVARYFDRLNAQGIALGSSA